MTNLWVVPSDLGATYSDSEYADDACQMASNILWAMSGRKYHGISTVTERYITSIDAFRYQGISANNFQPHLVNGSVYNMPSEDWNDSAYQTDGTSSLSRIRLRGKPVQEIHLLRSLYDGQIINPDYYYVAEHSEIRAYTGTPWPPGNVEVTYTYGIRVPTAGRMAAKLFAIELIKFWTGDDCALPDRVTSISRQGVSYTVLDNQDFLENMRIGIYAVDLFIKTANPSKALAPSKVFSPDIPRARRAAPSRPIVLTADATKDVVLSSANSFTGSKTITCTGANAGLTAYNNASYTLRLEAVSWNGYYTKTYASTSAAFSTSGGITYIDLTFAYMNTYGALGPNDPGKWVLYAVDGTGATIQLLEGNLQIKKVLQSQINPVSTTSATPTRLTCQQGATFTRTMTWSIDGVAVDITNYTAAMQVRASYSSTSSALSLVSTSGATKVINSATVSSNIATVTTATNHGLTSGSTITLFNLTASSGSIKYIVLSAPTATTFTIAYAATNGALVLGTSPTSTLNAGITLGGAAGTIVVTIDADYTSDLIDGSYVYDLELTSSSGTVTRLLEGQFVVTPEVTTI
jgi:hypothetical protein